MVAGDGRDPCARLRWSPQTTIILGSDGFGMPATGPPLIMAFSIWHWLWPLSILKKPLSPQSSFQLFATSQYGAPFSVPHPMILMAWPPSIGSVMKFPALYTPDL